MDMHPANFPKNPHEKSAANEITTKFSGKATKRSDFTEQKSKFHLNCHSALYCVCIAYSPFAPFSCCV